MFGDNPKREILEELQRTEDSPERAKLHVTCSSIIAGLCAKYCVALREAKDTDIADKSKKQMERLVTTFEKLLAEDPAKIECDEKSGELKLTQASKETLSEKVPEKTDPE